MLRAMTLFTADNLNRGIFPKCHSLTIVREWHKIKSIWFGASTASLLSESARWTMPIFRDVYDWAGQFRTVPLAKADYVHGSQLTRFTLPELIEEELEKVFGQLAEEHYFAGLQRKEFARKVAALLSEINRIHPFRE